MEASHYEAIANPDDPVAVKTPWSVRRRFILAGAGSAFAICAFIFWTSSSSSKHSHAHTTSVASLSPLLLKVSLPYPESATITEMVVCNYMGKPYTFTGQDDLPIGTSGAHGKYMIKVMPVQIGELCTIVPISKSCRDTSCWKRGTINGGDGDKQITAGVNVISRISAGNGPNLSSVGARQIDHNLRISRTIFAGESVCTIRCLSSRLLCEAQTVVFIAPVHCREVKVTVSSSAQADPPFAFAIGTSSVVPIHELAPFVSISLPVCLHLPSPSLPFPSPPLLSPRLSF